MTTALAGGYQGSAVDRGDPPVGGSSGLCRADRGDAATERAAVIAFIKARAAAHLPEGTGGRLDAVAQILAQLAYAIERREHHKAQPDPASP